MVVSFHDGDDGPAAWDAAAALAAGGVQVWTAAVPSNGPDEKDWTADLGPDELARAERFLFAEPRRQYKFAHVFLRRLLGACLQAPPASLRLGRSPSGKPFLEADGPAAALRFNLSHSGDRAAAVLSRGREVGVDIERIDPDLNWRGVAGPMFSAREMEGLSAFPESRRREAFFALWTCKEAYLKAVGTGLVDIREPLEFIPVPGKPLWRPVGAGGNEAFRRWAIEPVTMPPCYVGRVVFERLPGHSPRPSSGL